MRTLFSPKHLLPALFVVIIGTAVARSLLASQEADWKVVVAANAFVSHGTDTEFTPADVNTQIRNGDRLTTRAGGALVIARGEDVVTLAENTQISIKDPQPANSTLIEQPYGQAHYHVEHKAVPHFEVDTPLVATVVKGTTFTVKAGATAGSVSVQDGRVTAVDRRTGASASVSTGETGTVQNGTRSVSVSKTAATSSAEQSAPADASDDASAKENGKSKNDSSDNSGNGNSGNGKGNSGNGNGNNGNGNGNGSGNSNGGGNGNSGNGNGGGNSGNGNGGGNGGGNGNGHGNGGGKGHKG
jgi:hypothetical protein